MGAVPGDALLPHRHGFVIAEAVVVQAAQIIAGIGVGRIVFDGVFQNGNVLQPCREAQTGIQRSGKGKRFASVLTQQMPAVAPIVMQQRIMAPAQLYYIQSVLGKTGFQVIADHIQIVFRLLAEHFPDGVAVVLIMAQLHFCPQIQKIFGNGSACQLSSFLVPPQMAQDRGFQVHGTAVTGIQSQRNFQLFQSVRIFALAAVQRGQLEVGGAAVGIVPRGTVKNVVGFVVLAQILQSQTLQIEGFRVGGVLVAAGEPGNGGVAVGDTFPELAVLQCQPSHGGVAADVAGVPLQRFQIVVAGVKVVLLVLLQMEAVDVQLLHGVILAGALYGGANLDGLLLSPDVGLVGYQNTAILVGEGGGQVGSILIQSQLFAPAGRGGHVGGLGKENFFALAHGDSGIGERTGDIEAQKYHFAPLLQIHGGVNGGVLHIADIPDGIPVLLKLLGLKGGDPCKVRLVVGVDAGHQLNIGAVLVGEVGAPHFAEIAVSPCPHFLAGGNVVVGDGGNALLQAAVITGHKVHIGLTLRNQERGGHLHGVVQGKVGAIAVVKGSCGLVNALGDGPLQHRAAVVVVDPFHVRRENGAVGFVHRHRQIGPPHEDLGQIGAVVHPNFCLDVAAARFHGDTGHALHPIKGVHLAGPQSLAAVGIFFQRRLQRQEGGGAVMLGPVELDAAGDPCAGQTHQCGLDDPVAVDKVVMADLVIAGEDLAADGRQNLRLNIFVFQSVDLVGYILLFVGDAVGIGQGVKSAGCPLIGLLLEEHGHGVWLFGDIGGDHLLFPASGDVFWHK